MGRVILGILATASRIVVLDKILKDVGKEVVVFREGFLKREVREFVDHCTGKRRTLCYVCNILRKWLKERNLGVLCSLCREYSKILFGNVAHRIVEDEVKVALSLLVPQVGYQMFRFQAGQVGRQ